MMEEVSCSIVLKNRLLLCMTDTAIHMHALILNIKVNFRIASSIATHAFPSPLDTESMGNTVILYT